MHTVLVSILTQLVHIIVRRPLSIIGTTVAICLFCSSFLLTAKVDFSFLALMPVEDPLLVKFQKVADEVAINNQLLLLLESDSEDALNTGSEELLSTLGEHPDVAYAISTPSREWFEKT